MSQVIETYPLKLKIIIEDDKSIHIGSLKIGNQTLSPEVLPLYLQRDVTTDLGSIEDTQEAIMALLNDITAWTEQQIVHKCK